MKSEKKDLYKKALTALEALGKKNIRCPAHKLIAHLKLELWQLYNLIGDLRYELKTSIISTPDGYILARYATQLEIAKYVAMLTRRSDKGLTALESILPYVENPAVIIIVKSALNIEYVNNVQAGVDFMNKYVSSQEKIVAQNMKPK